MQEKKKLNKNLTDNATSDKSPTIDEQFKQKEKLEKNTTSYKSSTIDELFKQEEKFGRREFGEKYKFMFSNDEIFNAQRMDEIEYESDLSEKDFEIGTNKTETLNNIILEEKKTSNVNNENIDINMQQKPIFTILNKKLGRRRKKKGKKSAKHTNAS
jgi:hypothetical protein